MGEIVNADHLSDQEIKYIISVLRRGSITWTGRTDALKAARKKVKEESGREKYYWQCSDCEQWFRDHKEMEVDHKQEVGPFNGDWNQFIGRVYSPQDNLQVLCTSCHAKKTSAYNSSLRLSRDTSNFDF